MHDSPFFTLADLEPYPSRGYSFQPKRRYTIPLFKFTWKEHPVQFMEHYSGVKGLEEILRKVGL